MIRFITKHTTGANVYAVVRRLSDNYLLNDADGTVAAAPADPYKSLTEDSTVKGIYTASESRSKWTDGEYLIAYYAQTGGSPNPSADQNITSSALQYIRFDTIVSQGDLSDRLTSILPFVLAIKKALDTSTVFSAIMKKLDEIRVLIAETTRKK